MAEPFIYDTHYQVDKPFAFLDLTLATASPTEHASDDVLARRLEGRAKTLKVAVDGELTTWKPNRDQMRYWIGNCHASGLLSRQNSYDYWLMNFRWIPAFAEAREFWGQLQEENSRLARLLLLRWAWVFDAPLSANMSETATPWKFSVEGEQGSEANERSREEWQRARDRGRGEADAAAVHARVQAQDRAGGGWP